MRGGKSDEGGNNEGCALQMLVQHGTPAPPTRPLPAHPHRPLAYYSSTPPGADSKTLTITLIETFESAFSVTQIGAEMSS